ncbi:MAG: hypothetical protein EOP09_14300, partial [Proteobacteria bacterium]
MVTIRNEIPDFYLQTIFSAKAQARLFSEARDALIAGAGFDLLSHTFDEPIQIETPLNTAMGAQIRAVVEGATGLKFGDVGQTLNESADLQLRYATSHVKIEIEGLKIESPHASMFLDRLKAVRNGLDANILLKFRRTVISAKRIHVSFRTDDRRSFMNKFFVELKETRLTAKKLLSLSVALGVRARNQPDGSVKLHFDPNVLNTFDQLTADTLMSELDFEPGTVRVPEQFTLQIGNARMAMRKEGVSEALQLRKAAVYRLFMDPITELIKDLPKKLIAGPEPGFTIPAIWETVLPCVGKIGIRLNRYGQVGSDQLQFGFNLVHSEYQPRKENSCFSEEESLVHELIDRNDATVVMGVRDQLVSFALNQTLGGCKKDILTSAIAPKPTHPGQPAKPSKVILGPKGFVARMDELGEGTGVVAAHAQVK